MTTHESARRIGLLAWLVGTAALLALFAAPVQAQDAKADTSKTRLVIGQWVPTLATDLNFSQAGYTENWRGAENGSLAWAVIAHGGLENQLSRKANWNTTLKLAFGQTHQQMRGTSGRGWDRPQKSTDLIDLESIMRFTLGGYVDPFASVRAESQFQDITVQTDSTGVLMLNPWRFTESAGIARRFVDLKERQIQTRFGLSFREGWRRDWALAGAPPYKKTVSSTTVDGGFESVTDAKWDFGGKRLVWTSRLSLYQPVFYSGKSALYDAGLAAIGAHSMMLDADFENVFSSQVVKPITISLYTRWVYDEYANGVKPKANPNHSLSNEADVRSAIRRAGQFKETLAVGITVQVL